jgi:hypothetical protein
MSSLDRSLERWQAAGLIDADTARAIGAYEASHARPLAQWAIAGLGLLALALGIALEIAANWDLISAPVKLGGHLFLTALAAFAVWQGQTRNRPWQTEGALFLLCALVLAGIALQGQVYQLSAPMWQALAFWALLCVPAQLLAGSTRLTGVGLGLMLGWLAGSLISNDLGLPPPLKSGSALAMPFLILLGSLVARGGQAFAASLRDIAIAYLLGLASLAHFAWATSITGHEVQEAFKALPIPLIAATLCVIMLVRAGEARVLLTVVLATFAATALAAFTPHGEGWQWRLFGALVYTGMWGTIGQAALAKGWRQLFGLSIGMIALRLFIIYFELFGSLATTGLGLILSGALVLALLAGWRQIMRLVPRKAVQS